MQNKSQLVTAVENLGKPVPLQDRNAGNEKSAEQPLVAEGTDMHVWKDAELAPKYGFMLP